jgi:hypothetical protein
MSLELKTPLLRQVVSVYVRVCMVHKWISFGTSFEWKWSTMTFFHHGSVYKSVFVYTLYIYQYNETNVLHFSFSLLRIKSLYMFRALLAHPNDSLHKRYLVYCVRVMSVGCATETATVAQPTDIRTQYNKCRSWSAFLGWASNARNM